MSLSTAPTALPEAPEATTESTPHCTTPPRGGLRTAMAWRGEVVLTRDSQQLSLVTPERSVAFRRLPSPVADALAALAGDGCAPHVLAAGLPGPQLRVLDAVLRRVGHLVVTRLLAGDLEVMRVNSTSRDATYELGDVGDRPFRLHRFALLRSRGDDLVMECPTSLHRFTLTSPAARMLAALVGQAGDVRRVLDTEGMHQLLEPLSQHDDLSPELLVRSILAHWVGAGIAEVATERQGFGSDTDPRLVQWDFHDLLMHSRSRSGRFDEPLGALRPYRGSIPALPAVSPVRVDARATIDLPRPDPSRLAGSDLPLAAVLESRRSIRDYAPEPLSTEELGEFLHRTFRVRALFDPDDGELEQRVSRPYPSGGGLYEHELYLTVRRCVGLDAGIYRYDPLHHHLELINDQPGDAREMLNVAAAATGLTAEPDVLITLTARFQRMSWRYKSIAYANMLRNTGAIYQTMYLIATAMDLAPCALGNGDADLSARVLGLDYLSESSVGDFLLGRRRPDDVLVGDLPRGWAVPQAP